MALNLLNHSRISYGVAQLLINVESLSDDMQMDLDTHLLCTTPVAFLWINNFQNDDYCESYTRFKKDELSNLIVRLGFEEHVCMENKPGHFYRFHREGIFMHTLPKLAHGLLHTRRDGEKDTTML